MEFRALRDPQKRDRYLSLVRKAVLQAFRPPCQSKAVFVLGKQRSGTSMLMYAFHRHPGVFVYDEHRSNKAFNNYRLRQFDVIEQLIRGSSFPVVCFKPICDSHLASDLARRFPGASLVWMYRDYRDVANSSVRKFKAATRAITLICERKPGGGWLQEGVSEKMLEVLARVYRKDRTPEELSCLVWWVRNQSIIESGLLGHPDLTVLKYEALVERPEWALKRLFMRLGAPYWPGMDRRINRRSIGRYPEVRLDTEIVALCEATMETLDEMFHGSFGEPIVQGQKSAT